MSEPKKRLFHFDFIRSIAIILIIIHHYKANIFLKESWNFVSAGDLGVSLFIILSGAGLMLSTLNSFDLMIYLKHRFFAIYPLFWCSYIVSFSILFFVNNKIHYNGHPLKFVLTIMGIDGFTLYTIPNYYLIGEWFLGFIIISYLIFPILRYCFLRNKIITLIGCLLLTIILWKLNPIFGMRYTRFPLTRLMEFVFGMMFIYYYRAPYKIKVVATSLILLLLAFFFDEKTNSFFRLLLISPCLFVIISFLSEGIKNNLIIKLFQFVSLHSYAAFLLHHIIIKLFFSKLEYKTLSLNFPYLSFTICLTFIFIVSFFTVRFSNRLISYFRFKHVSATQ